MGWSNKTTIKQDFKVKVKLEDFLDRITELIIEDIEYDGNIYDTENDDSEFEDWDYVMSGNYTCEGKSWYSPQTMWEPAEYDEERPYIDYIRQDALKDHAEELISLIKFEVEEDSENAKWNYSEPDDY